MENNYPAWYQSTQGPQLSATIKFVLALLLPTVKTLFPNVTLVSEQWDAIIDAVLILGFGIGIIVAHVRAKRTLGAKIESLEGQVRSLGGSVK